MGEEDWLNKLSDQFRSCGEGIVKYLVFLFNFLLAICGLILVIAGAIALADLWPSSHFLDTKILLPPIIILVIGILTFFVAFLGCCGVLARSHCMLTSFAIILLAIIIIQMIAGAIAIIAKDDFSNSMRSALKYSLGNYSFTNLDGQSWDAAQRKLECCGVDGPRDWAQVFTENQVPASCCRGAPDNVNALCRNTFDDRIVYQIGCYAKLQQSVRIHSNWLIGLGLGLVLIEILGVILACIAAKSIRDENRNNRRWFITDRPEAWQNRINHRTNLLRVQHSAPRGRRPPPMSEQRAKMLVEEEEKEHSNEPCNLVLAKKALLLFDVLLALAALRLIFIGYQAFENIHIFDYFLGAKMAVLPVIYIFDGICTFLLTFLGCVGAFTQNPRTLVAYSLGVLACILLQIIGGFYTLYHRFFFKNPMRAALKASMLVYNSTIQDNVYRVWHDMQRLYECCGVDSPRDWMPYFSLSYVPVPLSCCNHYEEKLRKGEKCYARLNESSYQLGCYTQLQTVVADRFNWILLSGIAPTLTEMVGLMLTLIVAKAIKTDIVMRKTRPWTR